MPKIEPFERFPQAYEAWFERHPNLYEAEIEAIKSIFPPFEKGIEIGIGSGRFALPLGIMTGVEPSAKMAEIARSKGIEVIEGVAEELPVEDESFDFALMVTTICFVDDPLLSLQEIRRILKPEGYVIIGFVDRDSALGQLYEKNREESRFYREARFYSADEVAGLLKKAGFAEVVSAQTLFGETLEQMETSVKKGSGEGAFVAVRARKERA
jgi:SAM-dependent methyltransferase